MATSDVTRVDVNGDKLHSPPLKRGRLPRWCVLGTYVMSRTVVVATTFYHPAPPGRLNYCARRMGDMSSEDDMGVIGL